MNLKEAVSFPGCLLQLFGSYGSLFKDQLLNGESIGFPWYKQWLLCSPSLAAC